MKKIFSVIFLIILLSAHAYAETAVFINGEKAEIPPEMGIIRIEYDRTFVPVRFLLEYFRYDVSWDGEDKVVFGRNTSDSIFVMQVGSNNLTYSSENGDLKTTVMDVSPFLDAAEGRTYIPLRFIAESTGYDVDYNDTEKAVMLNKK